MSDQPPPLPRWRERALTLLPLTWLAWCLLTSQRRLPGPLDLGLIGIFLPLAFLDNAGLHPRGQALGAEALAVALLFWPLLIGALCASRPRHGDRHALAGLLLATALLAVSGWRYLDFSAALLSF